MFNKDAPTKTHKLFTTIKIAKSAQMLYKFHSHASQIMEQTASYTATFHIHFISNTHPHKQPRYAKFGIIQFYELRNERVRQLRHSGESFTTLLFF